MFRLDMTIYLVLDEYGGQNAIYVKFSIKIKTENEKKKNTVCLHEIIW